MGKVYTVFGGSPRVANAACGLLHFPIAFLPASARHAGTEATATMASSGLDEPDAPVVGFFPVPFLAPPRLAEPTPAPAPESRAVVLGS